MMNDTLREIDRVLRLVDREVWIVTAEHGRKRAGLTATWVSQASIDAEHPLLVIGLATNHRTAEVVDEARAFAVHLLPPDGSELAYRFAATSSRETDKFAELPFTSGPCGSPILANTLAWLDCRVVARYEAGDRIFYWGRPAQGEVWQQNTPLREQQFFRALSNEQLLQLACSRDADIAHQRPLRDNWLRQ